MLQFVDLKQETPVKEVRLRGKVILMKFTMSSLQKRRKSNQVDVLNVMPFCQIHCPLSNNIPDWLKLTAEGRRKKLMKFLKAQTTCQKFVVESPQDRLLKVIVLLNNQTRYSYDWVSREVHKRYCLGKGLGKTSKSKKRT